MYKYGGIIYDRENYSDFWKSEALNRGLKNFKTYYDICLEDFVKYHSLEVRTVKSMVVKDIVPSAMKKIKTIRDVVEFLPNI